MSSIHEADWWHRRCDVLETRLRELRAAVREFVDDYEQINHGDKAVEIAVYRLEYELTKHDNDGN